MKKLFYILSFFSFIFFFTTCLFAVSPRVAVMPFENANKDSSLDWLSMGIPETITNDLLNIKGLVLVERVQLRKVLEEQKLQLTGAIDDKTVVQVGKLIGASVLVVGAFQKQEDTIRLTARFVDVQTAGVIQTAKVTGKMNDIFDLQVQIVKDLAKNLNIELKQEELAKLSERPTESLEAYQHFGQGALLQAKNDYQGAVKELNEALKVDPKFADAREKFKEVFWSLNQGNYWTYESKSKGQGMFQAFNSTSRYTRRAGGLQDLNGIPVFSYSEKGSGESAASGKSESQTTRYYFKGEDGICLMGQRKVVESSHSNMDTLTVFDSPVLVFPYELKVGKNWKSKHSAKQETKVNEESREVTIHYKASNKIIGKEIVDLPIGKLECFIIESKSESESSGSISSGEMTTTYWFASGIGIIKEVQKQESFELLSGGLDSEKILVDYHIE